MMSATPDRQQIKETLPAFNKLKVSYNDEEVGALALTPEGLMPFEYSKTWLATGFALNPFTLPLRKGVHMPKREPLEGMFGVFADSMPDGWGRLLVDRMLRAQHIPFHEVSNFLRLAIVGASGMGALSYEPQWQLESPNQKKLDLDRLAQECADVLSNKGTDDLDQLFALGGSSGGARPKILVTIDDEDWIIKFPSSYDSIDIGEQEYAYALCAQECGIEIPEVRLFPSKRCAGYFGAKRFDRASTSDVHTRQKIHKVSAAGLLETSHRIPNLDYLDLMRLTLKLTNDYAEVKRLFRLMCFNVFAHNRDDHSKNFSFVYDRTKQQWVLSPAYDLTYSSSFNGEHATTVSGNGKNPQMEDVLAVAQEMDISRSWAKKTAEDIKALTQQLNPTISGMFD